MFLLCLLKINDDWEIFALAGRLMVDCIWAARTSASAEQWRRQSDGARDRTRTRKNSTRKTALKSHLRVWSAHAMRVLERVVAEWVVLIA